MTENETPFPQLLTDRLRLRQLDLDDAAELFAIYSDPQTMQWFGVDPLTQLEQAQNLIVKFMAWRTEANPGTRWGIERMSDGRLIGTCGLFKWHQGWHKCALGYELSRAAVGQGYMQEALRAILPWGMREMNLNRIEAQIHPANLPSIRLVERLNFAAEGTLREAGYWGGEFHDLLQYALLRRDYVAARVLR
jgi:[ribosomal protein S5]-alanine N-acetyltransferase